MAIFSICNFNCSQRLGWQSIMPHCRTSCRKLGQWKDFGTLPLFLLLFGSWLEQNVQFLLWNNSFAYCVNICHYNWSYNKLTSQQLNNIKLGEKPKLRLIGWARAESEEFPSKWRISHTYKMGQVKVINLGTAHRLIEMGKVVRTN